VGRPSLMRGYSWGTWPSEVFPHGGLELAGIADFGLSIRRGFDMCGKGLKGALTLLGLRVC
jgi:hypothetical protein